MRIRNRVGAAVAVLALTAGGVLVAAPSWADDTAEPVVEVSEVVETVETEPAVEAVEAETIEPTTPEVVIETEPPATSPIDPPSPAYWLLLWEAPGGEGSMFDPDQVLVDDLQTDIASLDSLDNSPAIKCGTTYQADLEWNNAITAALVTGGVLHDPNSPEESHAYGALGDGVNPWKVWTTAPCNPEQPEPFIEHYVDTVVYCDGMAFDTSYERVTSYVLVEGEWVLGTPGVWAGIESIYRSATEEELAGLVDCPTEQPEDKSVTTPWVDGKPSCGDRTVTQTSSTTTTPYVLVEGEWVLDPDPQHTRTMSAENVRALTAAELAALETSCGGGHLASAGAPQHGKLLEYALFAVIMGAGVLTARGARKLFTK